VVVVVVLVMMIVIIVLFFYGPDEVHWLLWIVQTSCHMP
jgi:hypothetical protein